MERTASAIPRDPELTTGEPPLSEEEAARIRAVLGARHGREHRRAYRGNWQAFEAWAASTERAALPASSAVVAAHLAELAQSVKLATLKLRRAGNHGRAQGGGLVDPCASEMVKRVLDGLKRDAAERGEDAPKRTAGLTQAGAPWPQCGRQRWHGARTRRGNRRARTERDSGGWATSRCAA